MMAPLIGSRRAVIYTHRSLFSPCFTSTFSRGVSTSPDRADPASIALSTANTSAAHPSSSYIDLSHISPVTTSFLRVSPKDFVLYPAFLSSFEQDVLLRASLRKLDLAFPPKGGIRRQSRSKSREGEGEAERDRTGLEIFEKEGEYEFWGEHYDEVIQGYREILVSSWPTKPTAVFSELSPVLSRLYTLMGQYAPLLPSPPSSSPAQSSASSTELGGSSLDDLRALTQTHVLHLSSRGHILPHVDNVEASGSVILGVSLGGERVMRMRRKNEGSGAEPEQENAVANREDTFEVLLPPGSVYVQRDAIRYKFEHSIPALAEWRSRKVGGTQRVSVMLRDKLPSTSSL